MSDLTEARAELARQYRGYVPGEEADVEAAIDALLLAYRSALAGETFPDDAAREVEFVECEQDSFGWDGYHTEDAVAHARMFRRQRDSLLLQLQDKEERINELEKSNTGLAGGLHALDADNASLRSRIRILEDIARQCPNCCEDPDA